MALARRQPQVLSSQSIEVSLPDTLAQRVVIENVRPRIDDGRFPIKRTPGEVVVVTADVFADGHDELRVVLRDRPTGREDWRETPMTLVAPGTDEWTASFSVDAIGWHEHAVVAWIDRFATWQRDLRIKMQAQQDVSVELAEGSLLHPDDRSHATQSPSQRVWVDRERARFSAWYEMFPRSAGSSPGKSGTFREAAERLPDIADLGFDVVYLPPIHPIGTSFRKGPNNCLVASASDPGSPWAIGSQDGGHTAIDPGLGTFADFEAFRRAAVSLDLEIALDLAWQCSPDHPWVEEHPEWFRHRPDGTIKYAENPPKKYHDIYPFDFECEDWRGLWRALLDVTLFWVDRGVRIFRVDNPHTKTFGFWEWMIDEVHARDPHVLFLSEAFTRPKLMKRLAKEGFTQSYTYFTWRNTKQELTDYFTELTTTDVREYLRPNLFANTPDILHAYLQQGGRPAFEARLLLAATLGAAYGIYSGFELCENRAVAGTEEYADSEKYQFRQWDWHRAGNIRELIARVNQIRRSERALQFNGGLTFHDTDNEQIIAFSKSAPDGTSSVLVVVNLDPLRMQHGWVRTSLAPAPGASFVARDLLDDTSYSWRGEWNYVRLDPGVRQGHILKLESRIADCGLRN